jgi:DNA primase
MKGKGGTIPRSFIETLLNRADIVQVINQRVPLKKAGSNYKACCPFHDEKTPSFNVNQQKQFYHCFGCGASGDALKFLMEYDGLPFVEAVETLASQYGMTVPYEKSKQSPEQVQQQKDLYEVMHSVAKFYRHQLRDHPQSEKAKAYLRQRGLSPEIAKTFVIGYAPEGWQVLQPGLHADAQLTNQLIQAGMLVQNEEGKIYDRFRDRIMFPIRDVRGRVIAFGGRILGDGQPKYLNSPETPIFHKSQTLYGLYEMKQSRQNFTHILVVEGYMDVVALAQYGIRNAVATLGTATTEEHLDLLFRQVDEVVFCFDGDEAGLKAAWKALELCLPMMEQDRSVKFLFLEQGEDPDSTVRKEGVEGFQQRVASALSLSQFLLQGLQGRLKAPLSTIEGRQQLVALATPFVQKAQGLFQFLLAEGVAQLVNLPTWRVEKEMGVRSGFANAQSSQKQPFPGNKSNFTPRAAGRTGNFSHFPGAAPAPPGGEMKVLSVPLKIVRILLKRPHWAQVFYGEFGQEVAKLGGKDAQILAQIIQGLQQNGYLAEEAVKWLKQIGQDQVLISLEQLPLPDEDAVLKAEFEVLMKNLAKQMAQKKISQQGWDRTSLLRLEELLKS